VFSSDWKERVVLYQELLPTDGTDEEDVEGGRKEGQKFPCYDPARQLIRY
jgi:hypothetical protein